MEGCSPKRSTITPRTTEIGRSGSRFTYDSEGRLSEFRAGRDKTELNDYVGFRYDPRGRPLGNEYYAQT
jgi:YD repeat-containing protein